ncbi:MULTISPECIES: hypothetical protein [unclassified Streptomyces]|uniref:hypothetical protein n=1 Tax=unclassified Streptomyces TaxID=2593676 RepID=UPI0036ED08E1
MTISPLALAAKKVIEAAWLHGSSYDLSSQAAFALESAQLLQLPETAAELIRLRGHVVELEQRLAAKDRPVDEDPITYALTDKADTVDDVRPQVRRLAGQRAQVAEPTDQLTRVFAPTQALREVVEGEHYATTHHDYRVSRDLPETGGAR